MNGEALSLQRVHVELLVQETGQAGQLEADFAREVLRERFQPSAAALSIPQVLARAGRQVLIIGEPGAGKFPISAAIRNSLDDLFVKSGLATQAEVDFRLSAGTTIGTHPVRQQLLRFTFGGATTAAAASQKLSEKLADSMDYRSPPALLMMTCLENGAQRRTIMWAFPQESGFQFRSDTAGARIRLLKDIFSHSSRLRKAAMFEGRSRSSGFASGRIIDHQAIGSSGAGADYWVDKFLECQFVKI